VNRRPATKRLRVGLIGGGAVARRLASALRRSSIVTVERSSSRGSSPHADLLLDLRRGIRNGKNGAGARPMDVAAFVGILAKEIHRAVQKEIEERQSDFVSVTSHELRTPLTSSREALAILADGLAGGITQEQRGYLEIASRNLQRLTSAINQLLDLSDIENGKMVLAIETVDMNEIVEAAMKRFVPRFEEKGLVARADADRIGHVLDALLDNACKFTPRGGEVSVRTRGTSRLVEAEVADTGLGIPAKARRAIFQKFRQLDRALTRSQGGLGLGLTLAREIVKAHRGTIRVFGRKGGGSRFLVQIPRGASEP
jgi:two-component system sensor histidine kinase VicK